MNAKYPGRCVRCQQPYYRGDEVHPIPPADGGDWTRVHATCPEPAEDAPTPGVTVAATCTTCGHPAPAGHDRCRDCRAMSAAGGIADCSKCANTWARIPARATTSPCCAAPFSNEDPAPTRPTPARPHLRAVA
jgi:hypothetical protein